MLVIVPSRARPDAAIELNRVFAETCTATTRLWFAVDDDDPTRHQYPDNTWGWPSRSMVDALNHSAMFAIDPPGLTAVAFMGDDHRPRTKGWDAAYLAALQDLGTGIVYGNDLLQRDRLATQVAMTADIVRALGYMAPPTLHHLYVDNYWMALGAGAECLRYLPNIIVEHLHPVAGKADWDDGYRRVNDKAMYVRDEAAFCTLAESGALAGDIAKVRALRELAA